MSIKCSLIINAYARLVSANNEYSLVRKVISSHIRYSNIKTRSTSESVWDLRLDHVKQNTLNSNLCLHGFMGLMVVDLGRV